MLRSPTDYHSPNEIGHYIRRAREERELATKAVGSVGSHAHLEQARRYEALIKRSHSLDDGRPGAADYESSNLVMSTRKLFPFYQIRPLAPHLGR